MSGCGCMTDQLGSSPKLRLYLPLLGIMSFTLALWMYLSPPSQFSGSFRPPPPGSQFHIDAPGCSSPAGQEKVPLVAVQGTHTLMVSAYLEHRYPRREVRVISIMKRSEKVVYQCLLCCDGQIHNSTAYFTIHTDHFSFTYGTADIMCPVPPLCGCPNHITLYSGTLSDNMDPPSPFIPVQNQLPLSDRDSFPVNFTVCISTMYDFDNVLQLVQTLEMFQLLGVGRVAIYRTNCNPAVQRVLDYYSQTGLVEVIPWHVSSHITVSRGWHSNYFPGELHYYGQLPALNDCVYRYMYQSRYLALQDIDELILPLAVENWYELLPQLEHTYGTNKGYAFESHLFRVRLRDMTGATLPLVEVAQWPGVPGLNILEHIYRYHIDPKEFNNYKIIVNPRAVFVTTVHGLLSSEKGCALVDHNVARLFHFNWKNESSNVPLDQLIHDDRILHYAEHLVPAVSEVLDKTNQKIDHLSST